MEAKVNGFENDCIMIEVDDGILVKIPTVLFPSVKEGDILVVERKENNGAKGRKDIETNVDGWYKKDYYISLPC